MSDRLTVAIAGAGGFIGGRLAEWLTLQQRAHVRPIVRSYKGMARLARFKFDIRIASATDQSALTEALVGCDVLFHCVVGDRDTILKSAEVAYRSCASAGVPRLVYLSSAVVHGNNPAPGTHDDSPLILQQPFEYNVSKVMAELLLRRLREDGAVEVVTLRPAIVFGPRSLWWTAKIADDLLEGRAFLVDGGSGICNTVYVDNLIYAMWQAAVTERAANQDFLITDGERVTWRDLYHSVAEALDISFESNVRFVDSVAIDVRERVERRRKRLTSLKPLYAGLAQTVGRIFPKQVRARLREYVRANYWGTSASICDISLDLEIASLQRCKYMLPIEKARTLLAYNPPYSFAEGCARAARWLRFAYGYDAHEKVCRHYDNDVS